jgi:hypothetical protein
MTESSFELESQPDFNSLKREAVVLWREKVIDTLRQSEGSPPAGASQDTWDLQSVINSVTPVFRTSDGLYAFEVRHEAAKYLEFGTSPHEITVSEASVLTDGEDFFGTRVDHPGTPALRFMQRSRDSVAVEYTGDFS